MIALDEAAKTQNIRVLCVDDEAPMLEGYARLLRSLGYDCITTTDGYRAIEIVKSESPHIVLTDLKMPGIDGIALLESAKNIDPDLAVIVVTAYATIPSAVEAVRKGAFDYVPKPFSADQLEIVLQKASEHRRLLDENKRLRVQLRDTYAFGNIIGKSQPMQRVFETVCKIAPSDANVLICGESGTGKELIARSIHANGPRANQGFVPVDCASLPETLLESELFGHEKGAFTGAHTDRPGLFEFANHGTVFLDEISDLAPSIQAKLLRVLQEHRVRRLGGRREIAIDIRIISASNRDLEAAVAQKQFREDLFYRLNVISIKLPPLRDRSGDIELLANHFLRKFGKSVIRPPVRISTDVIEHLLRHSWPGNVRELQNVIERAVSLCESDAISVADLPERIRSFGAPLPTDPMRVSLREARRIWLEPLEKDYLKNLLERHGGNVSEAARAAEIDRQTIYRLLKKYGIKSFE
ncbi:sigma-54-dependent Fis family transcriptional regulator [Candidatus Poribacteria bacterium]|nr:sigma-54-dependent Fis family transcriptional regulator [Candidatus Poribacteria bacterium]